MTKRRVIVLTTGGTIASKLGTAGRHISGAMTGESLLEAITPPRSGGVDVEVEVRSVLQKPSNAIELDDLVGISRQCRQLAEQPEVSGIVVTHGTDTLEETAHFLDITVPLSGCALVVTGAQRAPHQDGTDAYRNLADAITVAAAPDMAGVGVTVVFNQSLYAARQVRKLNTYQLHGFGAPGAGPLGYIDGQRVHLAQHPRRPAPLPLGESLPRVDILTSYLAASPELLTSSFTGGARGIVIEGLGRGHVPPTWLDAIRQATEAGVAVVVASVCHEGPVNTCYEFPGSLESLQAQGAIAAPDLSARKARLTLAVMLSTGASREEIASFFAPAMFSP
ncbi:L-asparaginase [Halomonas aestuarii]|uniref:L-asparaginase n=1 Tax=Halomonas aestuarii TaxID=1897729 RepID=A0A1J0VFN3_9GAMM|nr:asparaginase [Halomonas aestuarii]APE30815.1 L-asparaginase [Halomonas aestuarii]